MVAPSARADAKWLSTVSYCLSVAIGPISVSGSSGLPILIVRARATIALDQRVLDVVVHDHP